MALRQTIEWRDMTALWYRRQLTPPGQQSPGLITTIFFCFLLLFHKRGHCSIPAVPLQHVFSKRRRMFTVKRKQNWCKWTNPMGTSGAANGFCGGELGVIADSIAAATVCCKFPKICLFVTIVAISSVCFAQCFLTLNLIHIKFKLKRFTKAGE